MVIDPTTPTRDINRRLLLTIHQDGLFDIMASPLQPWFPGVSSLCRGLHF